MRGIQYNLHTYGYVGLLNSLPATLVGCFWRATPLFTTCSSQGISIIGRNLLLPNPSPGATFTPSRSSPRATLIFGFVSPVLLSCSLAFSSALMVVRWITFITTGWSGVLGSQRQALAGLKNCSGLPNLGLAVHSLFSLLQNLIPLPGVPRGIW